jgi:hypothetical protein
VASDLTCALRQLAHRSGRKKPNITIFTDDSPILIWHEI